MKPHLSSYVLVSLLAVACVRAESKPEPQVRAQAPVETIATRVQFGCPSRVGGCEGASERPPSKGTRLLVARLRQGQPSWYGYIRAVEVASKAAIVQTGILANEPGTALGARICRAVLGGNVGSAAVMGVANSPTVTGNTATVLATCRE